MRHLLLALPFALLPALAHAHDEAHHGHEHSDEHGSLASHEHGVAQLDAALDGTTLEIELRSPAINLLGFEHRPGSAAERSRLAQTRATLERPEALLSLPAEARCTLTEARLESPLFAEHDHDHDHDHHEHGSAAHNDIQAHYRYDCTDPDALRALDLRQLFEAFPGTERVEAQIIGPNGQQGAQLRAQQARIAF